MALFQNIAKMIYTTHYFKTLLCERNTSHCSLIGKYRRKMLTHTLFQNIGKITETHRIVSNNAKVIETYCIFQSLLQCFETMQQVSITLPMFSNNAICFYNLSTVLKQYDVFQSL